MAEETSTSSRRKTVRRPPRNTSFASLPESVDDPNEVSEADRIVAIVVEAKRTHVMMSKLHSTSLLLWVLFGIFHYHPSFEKRWKDHKFGILDTASLFQNLWGVLFLALVALRHDFPLNLFGITVAAFYAGIVFGVHAVRWN
jgi:hypothetical protein